MTDDDWKVLMKEGFQGYANLYKEGRVLDSCYCYRNSGGSGGVVKPKLSYNGTHYTLFVDKDESVPGFLQNLKLQIESPSTSAYVFDFSFDKHIAGLKAKANASSVRH